MWPDRVSSPGPLSYEPGAIPTALLGPACFECNPCTKPNVKSGPRVNDDLC